MIQFYVQNGSKMVLKPILGYFLLKRKTRVFPLFIGVCELFTTTLFIFLSTSTWAKKYDFTASLGSLKGLNFGLFCFWFPSSSLGIISKLYLKLYLKFKNSYNILILHINYFLYCIIKISF